MHHRGEELGAQMIGIVQPADVDLHLDERGTGRHPQPGRAQHLAGLGQPLQRRPQVRDVDHRAHHELERAQGHGRSQPEQLVPGQDPQLLGQLPDLGDRHGGTAGRVRDARGQARAPQQRRRVQALPLADAHQPPGHVPAGADLLLTDAP